MLGHHGELAERPDDRGESGEDEPQGLASDSQGAPLDRVVLHEGE